METIKDSEGIKRTLSDEIYVLLEDAIVSEYIRGTKVRLISGTNESPIVGYHFMPDWVTVCKVGAKKAQFIGVKKSELKRLDEK